MSQASFSVKLDGVFELNGESREALEEHLRQCMIRAVDEGLVTGCTESEVLISSLLQVNCDLGVEAAPLVQS